MIFATYVPACRKRRVFTNRSNRSGDNMKDELRTDSNPAAWRTPHTSQNSFVQPDPPLEFPMSGMPNINMYAQVRDHFVVFSFFF